MMDQFSENLMDEMVMKLKVLAIDSEGTLQRAEQSIAVTANFLQQLKAFIIGYSFRDLAEEIRFFKTIKPRFLKEHIYYTRLYHIEAERPVGSKKQIKQYYQKWMDNISSYFEHNKFLYQYYRTARIDYDDRIFIRNAENGLFHPEYALDIDNRFSTVYSQKIARMQAFEHLADYLIVQFELMDNPDFLSPASPKKSNLVWTDSNASLIELVYALHARGSINHGKTDMKQIVKMIEEVFNIQLGNFYQTVKSMRGRKKIRTPYLTHLIESAERKMDDTDMNF